MLEIRTTFCILLLPLNFQKHVNNIGLKSLLVCITNFKTFLKNMFSYLLLNPYPAPLFNFMLKAKKEYLETFLKGNMNCLQRITFRNVIFSSFLQVIERGFLLSERLRTTSRWSPSRTGRAKSWRKRDSSKSWNRQEKGSNRQEVWVSSSLNFPFLLNYPLIDKFLYPLNRLNYFCYSTLAFSRLFIHSTIPDQIRKTI